MIRNYFPYFVVTAYYEDHDLKDEMGLHSLLDTAISGNPQLEAGASNLKYIFNENDMQEVLLPSELSALVLLSYSIPLSGLAILLVKVIFLHCPSPAVEKSRTSHFRKQFIVKIFALSSLAHHIHKPP
jgi:hypothetical protein